MNDFETKYLNSNRENNNSNDDLIFDQNNQAQNNNNHKDEESLGDEYFSLNSKYYENLYLNQANNPNQKLIKNHELPRTIPNHSNQIISLPNRDSLASKDQTDFPLNQNDHIYSKTKLLNFNEKSKENDSNNLEQKIKKDILDSFQLEVINLKKNYDQCLQMERKNMEDEIQRKWNETHENLVFEIKTKIREEKEKAIYSSLYNKLRPEVELKIIKNEYSKIEESVKKDINEKLKNEFKEIKRVEMENLKRNFEMNCSLKSEQFENTGKRKLIQELSDNFQKEIEKKEREIKTKYMKNAEIYKTKTEEKYQNEFEIYKECLNKEINEIKSNLYRKKCSEKLKVSQINKIKQSLISKERTQIENAVKLEKAICRNENQVQQSFLSKENNDIIAEKNDKTYKIESNYSEFKQKRQTTQKNSKNNLKLDRSNLSQKKIQSTNQFSDENNFSISKQNDQNSVNLRELNTKIRNFSPKNNTNSLINENPMKIEKSELYYEGENDVINNSINTQKKKFEISSYQSQTIMSEKEEDKALKFKIEGSSQSLCKSLWVCENMPIGMKDFGKFLVRQIENEANYNILLEKELKKIKNKIKSIFDKDKTSDHCLLEYMLELWEKLEVSYERRYKILNEICKLNSNELYSFIDNETGVLTEYFKSTQNIYISIKNREKLKSKLQLKSTKNEISKEDKMKLNEITNELVKSLKNFKHNNNMDLIWKGMFYEWLINYENWFYNQN